MLKVSIYDQTNIAPVLRADLQAPGWKYTGGPAGYWLDADGTLQIINGVYDGDAVGVVMLKQIIIEADYAMTIPPRAGWVLSLGGRMLTIGNGGECLPVQSCLTIRTKWNPAAMQHGPFEMHGVPLPLAYVEPAADAKFLEALRTGSSEGYGGPTHNVLPTLFEPGMGFWRPEGKALPDATYGGGYGIEPISGFLRSPVDVLRNDTVMERQRIWCVHGATGLPVAHPTLPQGGYALTRGWKKPTVLPRFCNGVTNQYDDNRTPVVWNLGSCGYLTKLCGIGGFFYNGTERHDREHLIRSTRLAKAAKLIWNDAAAKRYLAMVAQECLWSQPGPSAVTQGQGSSQMGRAFAWMLDALIAAGRPEAQAFINSAVTAQMPNGQCMRMSFGSYNPVPDPWTVSPDVPNPFSKTTDVASAKEGFYLAHGFFVGRNPRNARLFLEKALDVGLAQGGLVPRDFGVGVKGGAAFAELDGRSHPENYDHNLGIGQGGFAFGKEWFLKYALRLPTPTQGVATSVADLKARLTREETGRSQTVAMMAFAETL